MAQVLLLIVTNLLQWRPECFLITVFFINFLLKYLYYEHCFLIFFQVLFVYPPEKPMPLKCKDLLSFCFPGGLEVRCMFNELLSIFNFLKLEVVYLGMCNLCVDIW